MKKAMLMTVVLMACTTARPDVVRPEVPVHSFTVGGKAMFGAWANEDCEAIAEYLCAYEEHCVTHYVDACSPESKQPVVAPTFSGWEALWSGCFDEIDATGNLGFDCQQLVPAGVF